MSPVQFDTLVFHVISVISVIILIWGLIEGNGYIFLLAWAVFGLGIAEMYYLAGDHEKVLKTVEREYEWTIKQLEKERETCRKYYDEDECIIKIKHWKADSLYYQKILRGESRGVY